MADKKIINDLVYPELSYKIIGILFSVFNELGYGYQEKYYQKAITIIFKENGINFKEQISAPLQFKGNKIGYYYLDFLIEGKLVLEIKKGDRFLKSNIEQVYAYLRRFNLKLGIIANFTKEGLRFKRIVNIK